MKIVMDEFSQDDLMLKVDVPDNDIEEFIEESVE